MESSNRKIESARGNGAKSHGPVTAEGKQASSLNALRHAFLAKTIVLNNESQPRFENFFQSHIDHLQPVGDMELDLDEEMTVAKWQQRGGWAVHTATLDQRNGCSSRVARD